MNTPLTLPDNEIIQLLNNIPTGNLYYVARRDVFVRGSDYYLKGRVQGLEWTKGGNALTILVEGSRPAPYRVSTSAKNDALRYHCDCPAWSGSDNCKHVVCAVLAVKNLLNPDVFKKRDDGMRDRLTGELLAVPAGATGEKTRKVTSRKNTVAKAVLRKEEKPEPPSPWSLVIEKSRFGNSVTACAYKGEEKATSSIGAPKALQPFVTGPDGDFYSYFSSSRSVDLSDWLTRHGGSFPLYWRDESGKKTRVAWDKFCSFRPMTELDCAKGEVKLARLLVDAGKVIRDFSLAGEKLAVDLEGKRISGLRDTNGWSVWNYARQVLGENTHIEGAWKDRRDVLTLPEWYFRDKVQCDVELGAESGALANLSLKLRGLEVKPEKAEFSYRLAIEEQGGGIFAVKPRCVLGQNGCLPSWRYFGTLTIWNDHFWNLPIPLRAKKRRREVVEIFLRMLDSENKKACEKVIKDSLSGNDLFDRNIKAGVGRLLKGAAENLFTGAARILCDKDGWYLTGSLMREEARLYTIPREVLGPDIFEGMQEVGEMTVTQKALFQGLPLLQERLSRHGITLEFKGKPVTAASWDFSFEAKTAGIDWFELRPEIRCDGKLVDEETWRRAMTGGGVVEDEDGIRLIDPGALEALTAINAVYPGKAAGKERKEIVQVPRLQILDWLELGKHGVKVKLPPEVDTVLERLTRFEKIEKKPLPAALDATLRPYQKEGYYWLSFLYENRFGGCLADDMGLGKTLQTIALLAGVKEGKVKPVGRTDGPHLVVMPPSLLFNWQSELERFCPELKVRCYAGSDRVPDFTGCDVVLTTYALARLDLERLKETQFNVIVFDEAQAVKNIYAATTGAVRQLNGYFKLAITGTPMENHLGEYHSIMDLALPGLLGDYDDFKGLIKGDVSPVLDTILRRTRPFILRRTKEKILKELPPKTEADIYLDLTEKQKALYTRTVAMIRKDIDRAYADKTAGQAQIIALTAIMRLRQLSVSPRLLEPSFKEESPKVEFLCGKLTELIEEGHSALVFSQFTSFLDIVEEALQKRDMPFSRLDGSTAVGKRKKLVEGFQEGKDASVFLLSLKAGGQGLNLTRASYVFHLDPWWNPAVENQASDRAHRIGQTNRVTITRILMRHTVEEKMMALKEKKQALFNAILGDQKACGKGFSVTKEDFEFLLG